MISRSQTIRTFDVGGHHLQIWPPPHAGQGALRHVKQRCAGGEVARLRAHIQRHGEALGEAELRGQHAQQVEGLAGGLERARVLHERLVLQSAECAFKSMG
eukprot:235608-Pelagomonas_calceolata.AAC.5